MVDENTQMLCSHDMSQSEDKMSQTNRQTLNWPPRDPKSVTLLTLTSMIKNAKN